MNYDVLKLVTTSMLVLVSFYCKAQNSDQRRDKYRIVIMTDMTHDDGNSLIRYLYYANDFDLQAIIVTPQLPDYTFDAPQPWEKAQKILKGYRQIYPQLVKHSQDFPSYDHLAGITKKGRGSLPIIWLTNEKKFSGDIAGRHAESTWDDIRFDDWIGEGKNPNGESKDSEGSEFLQQIFDKDDERPIFVQMWGGPITFVQAMYRYRQRQGEEKFSKLLQKLHIYGITLQDITFDYFINLDSVKTLDCGNFGTTTSTYKGRRVSPKWLLFDGGHFWRYIKVMKSQEVNKNDAMSVHYDDGGEGDTPAFLFLLSACLGLNDPLQPGQGSWGTRFVKMPDQFPDGYYSTCGVERSEIERWIPDAKSSFMARMKWSTHSPSEVNHHPKAAVNGDKTNRVQYISARPGVQIAFDATASSDPDGDELSYNWFYYPEAGTYKGSLPVEGHSSRKLKIKVPEDIGTDEIHLVLEVRDNGIPSLVAYKRIIIKGQ